MSVLIWKCEENIVSKWLCMVSVQNEIDRVNLEIQNAERDYDLNRAAELKYGTLLQLQKQLGEAEQLLEREMVHRPACQSACCSRIEQL